MTPRFTQGQRAPLDVESYTLTFGKYRGATLRQVAERDPDYIDWLLTERDDNTLAFGFPPEVWAHIEELSELYDPDPFFDGMDIYDFLDEWD